MAPRLAGQGPSSRGNLPGCDHSYRPGMPAETGPNPTKFDFYAMDCYRLLAEDKMAENLADEVIRASTDFDGTERALMRLAEARITLGVVAARQGDVEQAVHHGKQALSGRRKSLPSLLMANRDLAHILRECYPREKATLTYLGELHAAMGR